MSTEPAANPIEITRDSNGTFSGKTIPAPGSDSDAWSSGPMGWRDLVAELSARGQHSTDITDAFDAAGVAWPPDEAAL
jgi:hypothetical protein